ncbi:ADP-ribosylglycohydrolase family protein, partial [Streptomyces sp. NPDC020766]
MTPLRLTWVQPEDLLGHELHQASQDGREPSAIAARWHRAGGPQSPQRAGASSQPASPYLRALAQDLLDELADLPSRLKDKEPTALPRIRALCPNWPTTVGGTTLTAVGNRSAGAMGVPPLERSREWGRVGTADLSSTAGGLGAA